MYMHQLKTDHRPISAQAALTGLGHAPGSPAHTITALFSLLEEKSIAYCIPHGWEGLPERWGSDIDVIVQRSTSVADLLRLFRSETRRIGAAVVRARGGFITFGCAGPDGLPVFLNFDVGHDYLAGVTLIATGEDMLANRRRVNGVWVPAAATGFATGTLRAILRGRLDAAAALRLSSLHAESPALCREALTKHLLPAHAEAVGAAAHGGDWSAVIAAAPNWRSAEARRLMRAHPGRTLKEFARHQAGRLRRIVRPDGFHVVLLGPDGAGKSSTISALETSLAPLFARTEVKGFAPTLKQILRRKASSTATPHALKPRSLPTSLLRAAWWTVFAIASHTTLRWEKTRSTLILNDRHFIDILVDPVRYRYGGPRWLLRMIAHLLPKPDAVILLHGPAEILQARKKELTVEETARQCRDYLALVSGKPRSHVIDATQPFSAVVTEAARIVLAD